MPNQGDAVFTEILELSVATESFTSGLAALEQAYTDFLARIETASEGMNVGLLAVAEMAQLSGQVTELSTQFGTFNDAVSASMNNLDAGLTRAQEGISATSQALIDAQARAAQGQVETSGGGTGIPATSTREGGVSGILGEISSASGGMTGLLVQMAEFSAMWMAVGEAISVVIKLIESPFTVIKNGFEYLNQLQDQAASLQGSIAANAKYSADLGKNFEIAGHAAQQVAIEMQSLGVKMGVPASELEHIFTDVLESGGLRLTGTMQGVVNLTELFTLAMEKTSTSVETQRRIMMDIPKLLDGANVSGSRILTTLGLTNAQWQKIRTEALAHGDLVAKLSQLMQPYLSVVDQANLRQSRLVESIKLQSSIIAGAIALPLWQQFNGILQDVQNFLSGNQDALVGIGSKVVHVAENFGTMLLDVAKLVTGFNTASDALQTLVNLTNNWALASDKVMAVWAKAVGLIGEVQHATQRFGPNMGLISTTPEQADAIINPMGQALQQALDKLSTQARINAQSAIVGVTSGVTGILDTPVASKKAIPDPQAEKAAATQREETFRATQEAFRSELEKTKQSFAETEAVIVAQEKTGALTTHEATLQRVAAIQSELSAVQELIQKYTTLAAASGVKPSEIRKFDSTLTDTGNSTQSSATVKTTDLLAQDQATEEHTTQAHLERLRQMAIAHASAMLAIYKQEASSHQIFSQESQVGILTKAQLFDKEQELEQQKHIAIMANLSQQLANAGGDMQLVSKITDEKIAEDRRYTDSLVGNAERRAAINEKDLNDQQTQQNQITLLKLRANVAEAKAAVERGVADGDLQKAEVALASQMVKNAQQSVDSALKNLAEAKTITAKTAATENLARAQITLADAQIQSQKTQANTGAGHLVEAVFGQGTTTQDSKDMFKAPFDDFRGTVSNLSNAFHVFGNAAQNLVGAIQQGFQQGGVSGAIGAGLGSAGSFIGQLGSKFQNAPIIGSLISGVGQIFSIFGDLFTAAAKRIAKDIQKSVSELMNQYSNGQATLVQTISGLEQQRQAAITELSGQKGGQDQLNQLLPQIDNQIASLEKQQKDLKTAFENSLAVLQTQSSEIGNVLTTWQNINKQVTDYINAGGDAAKAAQFLSLSLEQQKKTAQDSLNQADDQAIQDAMQLNSLLLQRVNLAQQFAQQEFSLKNQDALERMASPGVNAAIAYQQQKAANDAQLTALDQQIQLYSSRVNMEKQVFTLAQSTADLQAQSNQLNLTALQATIQGWKDLQTIVASITESSAGLYSLNQNLFKPGATASNINTNTSTVHIAAGGIQINGAGDAQGIATALNKELLLAGSFGYGTGRGRGVYGG